MPVSASIYDSVGRGVTPLEDPQNALLKALQVQSARQQYQQGQQGIADDQALREATIASGGDQNKLMQLLYGKGQYKAASGIQKSMLDAEKARADIGHVGGQTRQANATAAKTEQETKFAAATQHAQNVVNVQSPQDAVAYIDDGIRAGIFPAEARDGAIQKLQSYPSIDAWKRAQTQAAIPALEQFKKDAEMARAQLTADTQIKTTGMNNDTSIFTNAATIAGQAEQGRLNRGNSMAIAGMADARQREANETSRGLLNQERQLKVETAQEKLEAVKRQREAGISSAGNQIAVIDKALSHPGRETSTGLSGAIDPRNYTPGTDATDFRAVLDQIGGSAFLQAFESLKGGGQITEVEGKKATDAIARLQRSQSDKEFKKSLTDLREVMTTGYKRLSGKDYIAPNSRESSGTVQVNDDAGYNALPSGTVFIGPDGKQRKKP